MIGPTVQLYVRVKARRRDPTVRPAGFGSNGRTEMIPMTIRHVKRRSMP